ncbi:MAG: response regulator [Candidatus Omnitrophota bacterium]|nr:response regulator [Candidatus Omnitrophota bacterium]
MENTQKLLVVDDEIDVRNFFTNFFGRREIEVLAVSNAEEAIKMVVSERPKAILLDIKLEGMDGIETLRRIKELDKQVKVIMVTGREDDEAKQETKRLGAYGFIHKPIELDEVEKLVMKLFPK